MTKMKILTFFCFYIVSQPINVNPALSEYKHYCESNYARPDLPKKYKLYKLLVFHRHGDRASLNVEYSTWKDKMCKVCDLENNIIKNCREQTCKDGNLSIKGYDQMKRLGHYLRENYQEILTGEEPNLRCTSVERTQSSLHGVLTGLYDKNVEKNVKVVRYTDDAFLIRKDCIYLTEQVLNRVTSHFTPVVSKDRFLEDDLPQRRADIYLTAMCNNIGLDCKVINCEKDIINDYIKFSFEAWKDQAEIMSRDEQVLKLTFGRFVADLKLTFNNKSKLNIFSVHDSSLTMLMAGFGIENKGHPPYASALFVELLNSSDGKYLRMIYNTNLIETTIDESPYIPLEKFTNYLNELEVDEDYVESRCKKGLILREEEVEDAVRKNDQIN